jgi:translation initiation factor IF-3
VDLGKKLLLRFAEDLKDIGQTESPPRLEGRNAHVIISPVKAAATKEKPKEKPPQPPPPAAPPAPAQ